jgi:transcription-repair coupling factor (superfamily II helicase)
MENNGLIIKKEDNFDYNTLIKRLLGLGYQRQEKVCEVGDFAVRGGVIDLWLERYRSPTRLDFLGDKIEKIWLLGVDTPEGTRELPEIYVIPFRTIRSEKVNRTKRGNVDDRVILSDIYPGDFIVHVDYGVGRFLGVVDSEDLGGGNLAIEYAKEDKLYVPISQLDRVTRYVGISNKPPSLSYLGSESWERIKSRVKHSVHEIARDLVLIYSTRENTRRKPYSPDTVWQKQLEDSFPFQLTFDQEKSLVEIKKDLDGIVPMDRILVGDVGFGKTELAVRAAFKVVQDNYQVAVLAPTTLLAKQEYHVFKERLRDFPVRVSVLSRFQNLNERRSVVESLAKGQVDIVIGTHSLLSSGVRFKNLGLLIIDEEHRFGVVQKERFKKIRPEVDVLSLSATPIPRTLQMILTKIRQVSVINTSPLGRFPIETRVGPKDLDVLREAVLRELSRGGQVFYVSNYIKDILKELSLVRKLFPTARVEIAHGLMKETMLEKVIDNFLSKQIDILICTNIISSGLDIVNANTIIVNNAQNFGLADLHQLRGRVGRGNQKAYALLFYPPDYSPSWSGKERLEAIRRLNDLGSGLTVSMKDLEIRGAGNLLGREQHGNVSLVGFELYCQLLSQAVEELRLG